MMTTAGAVAFWLSAFLLDAILGDPVRPTHPVRVIGRCIHFLEKLLYPTAQLLQAAAGQREGCPGEGVPRDTLRFSAEGPPVGAAASANASHAAALVTAILLLRGACLTAVIVAGTWLFFYILLELAADFSPAAAVALSVWLASTGFSLRELAETALSVARRLKDGDLGGARALVSQIVGRDCDMMAEKDCARAATETVAENTVDGIISPAFYLLLGGVPLMMAYKAVNTLDSMIGYRDSRYLYFGRAAAKLDDAANWLPARWTALLVVPASLFIGPGGLRQRLSQPGSAWRIWRRDARLHPSPNGGHAEAAFAGALSIRLGGWNRYQGSWQYRPLLGAEFQETDVEDVARSVRLMVVTCAFVMALLPAAVLMLAAWTGHGWNPAGGWLIPMH